MDAFLLGHGAHLQNYTTHSEWKPVRPETDRRIN